MTRSGGHGAEGDFTETVATTEGDSRIVVDPMQNILVGSQTIMRYLRVKAITTLYEWVELYGLPAIKRPDGEWMSSVSAIDEWIFLAAEVDNDNRAHSRGYRRGMAAQEKRLSQMQRRLQSRMIAAEEERKAGPLKRGPKDDTRAREIEENIAVELNDPVVRNRANDKNAQQE